VSWVSAAHPNSNVEVWAQDEARVGLIPILRRTWAPVGQRLLVPVNRKYEWVYVYGFVHPNSGRVFWLLLPKMNAVVMGIALAHFAAEVGAGPNKQIVLLLDGAPSHTAHKLVVPEGIHLVSSPQTALKSNPPSTSGRSSKNPSQTEASMTSNNWRRSCANGADT